MLNFDISWPAVLVLTAVNFIFSWLWYSPLLFARPWMIALKMDPDKKEMTEEDKKRMPFLFLSGLVASFVFVYIIAILVKTISATDFISGATIGLVCWVGFSITHSLNTLWEGRVGKVLIINNGLYLLTYGIFGGVLAIWR